MTGVQVVGVLVMVLGLVCALIYVGWLRRSRKNASAAVATEPAASQIVGPERPTAAGLPRALTLAWVEGTYISTTMAISRHEHVAAAGLGVRARATMVVDDSNVRWEREGTGDVRVAGTRLLGVSLKRGMAGKFIGQARIVLVLWHADNGDRYATGFLPRSRADSTALVSAVQRLMRIGASIDDAPTQTETGPQSQVEAQTTPDGTP